MKKAVDNVDSRRKLDEQKKKYLKPKLIEVSLFADQVLFGCLTADVGSGCSVVDPNRNS